MDEINQRYISPFSTRYASDEMQYIFSQDKKFKTWRKLWVALAKAEKNQGLNISQQQIEELESQVDNINYEVAQAREKECRHDVMSHIYAYGEQCPLAKPIIHLGATSCYVGDNTDLIIMRDALKVVKRKILNVIALLSDFALKYKDLPTLGYTHLQPAQLTTVGKRATLWIYDLYTDLILVNNLIEDFKFLGSKGATGTQASFVELFGGDHLKIKDIEMDIANQFEFKEIIPVSGQTYSRKLDYSILSVLGGIAQSTSKFSNDIRILQNFKEIEEPFERDQIGSSAMPYKRNPMRSERITSISRYVMVNVLNPAFTAGTQWFERTLDDSANKRICVSESFLAVDSILNIMINVCDGLVVYPKVIESRVMSELPFMVSENILMVAVKKGGDRQYLHEKIRKHSLEASKLVKEQGLKNDLIERISADSDFNLSEDELSHLVDPNLYIGASDLQTQEFINDYINPEIEKSEFILGEKPEIKV